MTVKKIFSERELRKTVRSLAKRINQDYQDKELLIIGCLTGSFVFIADLIRELKIPVSCDFIKLSSYENRMSAGEIKLLLDVALPIKDRHILIVDDIVDTGRSLQFMMDHLRAKRPASLESCVLLYKESGRVTIPKDAIKYLGRVVPDLFVVGYGVDYAQKYRELPYIGYVIKE